MRRYATVQKARDADVFGILIGTLGVASYIPMIKHVRLLLTRAGKKSYTVSVGKLNPSKLANFTEIECFVLIACPENSVIDSKEFLRPIITPFELEFALGLRAWSGNYILDFDTLLKESTSGNDSRAVEEEVSDPDQPVFSLITGQYRTRKRYGKEDDQSIINGENGTVALRNSDGTVTRVIDSAAGEFLQGRTFRGLEPRLGQDAPSELEQGRSGIARGYGETVSNEDNHS
ncbi:Diphthamide biosynthesis protein 2 [Tulasnella sp. 418]|nr:Diphthamide biosynthesis protein 2 [Tulasnella sp. 418]